MEVFNKGSEGTKYKHVNMVWKPTSLHNLNNSLLNFGPRPNGSLIGFNSYAQVARPNFPVTHGGYGTRRPMCMPFQGLPQGLPSYTNISFPPLPNPQGTKVPAYHYLEPGQPVPPMPPGVWPIDPRFPFDPVRMGKKTFKTKEGVKRIIQALLQYLHGPENNEESKEILARLIHVQNPKWVILRAMKIHYLYRGERFSFTHFWNAVLEELSEKRRNFVLTNVPEEPEVANVPEEPENVEEMSVKQPIGNQVPESVEKVTWNHMPTTEEQREKEGAHGEQPWEKPKEARRKEAKRKTTGNTNNQISHLEDQNYIQRERCGQLRGTIPLHAS